MTMQTGKALIAGAGPGDLDLVTVGLMRALKEAEVILYDALVNPDLLAEASSSAIKLDVGKSVKGKDCRNRKQAEINEMMIRYAREGKHVLRLKGGDPLIFGRGSEECEILREAGIEYEILPGVSSASAGPAYAGIPLTHRELSRSVCFATGHLMEGEEAEAIRIPEADTLVFLMGVKNLEILVAKLLARGRLPKEPCALIENATTPRQRTVLGTLSTIVKKRDEQNIQPPALFVVGVVASLAKDLAWFEQKPLFGKTIVVTRAREQAGSLALRLGQLGAEVVMLPMIEIRAREEAGLWFCKPACLRDITDIVFTSENAVKLFFQFLFASGQDSRALAKKEIWTIGPKTAAALQVFGIRADHVPEKFQAEGITDIFPASLAGRFFLLPRAKDAREVLPLEIGKRGGKLEELILYESVLPKEVKCLPEKLDAVCFTSVSTVEHFHHLYPEKISPDVFAIGEITAQAARQAGFFRIHVAQEATLNSLIQRIIQVIKDSRL